MPSGASTGAYEAVELRDGDKKRYLGKGVQKAVDAVNGEILSALAGMDATQQTHIDLALRTLDGTDNKSRLGANAMLGVSLAVAKAAAASQDTPLWRYIGGVSAYIAGADDEYCEWRRACRQSDRCSGVMIMPVAADTLSDGVRMGAEIFHTLKGLLSDDGLSTGIGDEGGFAPALASTDAALEYIMKAIEKAGYKPGEDVVLALDAAATEFHEKGLYHLAGEGKKLDAGGMADYWAALCDRFPIASIEDGMDENDWEGWRALTDAIGARVQLVGDDVL